LIKQQKEALKARTKAKATTVEEVATDDSEEKTPVSQLIDSIPDKSTL
jgi:hypothetical protein